MSEVRPPRFIRWLMSRLCDSHIWESVEGDMHELFAKDMNRGKSRMWASFNYAYRSLAFLRFRRMWSVLSSKTPGNPFNMFNFLFRISARNLLKQRMVSLMSLLTLVLGAVSFQLVYSWIHNEKQMDQFHDKGDRLYIGTTRLSPNSDVMVGDVQRLFNLDYTQYPEIENHLVVHQYSSGEIQFIAEGSSFDGTALIADSTFFDLFSFPILYGDQNALSRPDQIIVTERFAKKVWGDRDPIGKRVEIKCDQKGTYQIASVLKDIPSKSSINFDYLIPRYSQAFWRRMPQNLLLLSKDAQVEQLNEKLAALTAESRFKEATIDFFPLDEVYQTASFNVSFFSKYGDKANQKVMNIVAFSVLLIMVFGFVNIQSTALLTMTRKLGVKRVIGAHRGALVFEVTVNMLLYFLIAVAVAFFTIRLMFEKYTTFMELHIDPDPMLDLMVISMVVGIAVLATVGIQVFRIQGINALQALTGKVNFFKVAYRQRAATALQYAVSISLLIATAIIYLQIKFMLNKETGLNQEGILQTRFLEIMPSARQDSVERSRLLNKYNFAMDQLHQHSDILAVSHGQAPLDFAYANSWKLNGSTDDYLPLKTIRVDPGYQRVFDLEVLEGRFFSDSLDQNNDLKVVINEAAMKYWGVENLEGMSIEAEPRGRSEARKFRVIGVVKDFHYEHLSQAIQPLIMPYFYYEDTDLQVRHVPGKEKETMELLEQLYHQVNTAGFFQANRFEDQVSQQYLKEKKTNKIYLSFGVVTLFLSCLSMFTFTFHETKRRTKEIGIRKVNGATIRNIFHMLTRSFLSTISLAFLVSCPVVAYLMNQWLTNFANRIFLDWWVFLGIGAMVIVLALLVITWHVLKVARINPVETLRYE